MHSVLLCVVNLFWGQVLVLMKKTAQLAWSDSVLGSMKNPASTLHSSC